MDGTWVVVTCVFDKSVIDWDEGLRKSCFVCLIGTCYTGLLLRSLYRLLPLLLGISGKSEEASLTSAPKFAGHCKTHGFGNKA